MVVVVVVAVTVVEAVAVAVAMAIVAAEVVVVVAVVVVVVAALSDPILFLPESGRGRRAHFPRSGWQPSLAPYLCHCKQATW